MERHQDDLHNHLCRTLRLDSSDADDAIQQTWLKVFSGDCLHQDGRSFKSWLYRIAINNALYAMRHRRKHVELSGDFVSAESSPLDRLIAIEECAELRYCIWLDEASAENPQEAMQVFDALYPFLR